VNVKGQVAPPVPMVASAGWPKTKLRQRADTYLLLMRISITERRSPGKIREKVVKTGRPMRGLWTRAAG
jgi:hypothetical protein